MKLRLDNLTPSNARVAAATATLLLLASAAILTLSGLATFGPHPILDALLRLNWLALAVSSLFFLRNPWPTMALAVTLLALTAALFFRSPNHTALWFLGQNALPIAFLSVALLAISHRIRSRTLDPSHKSATVHVEQRENPSR